MGKQARIKEKRRREEQKRNDARRRAIQTQADRANQQFERIVNNLTGAPTAERKALVANIHDLADTITANPGHALQAMSNAQSLTKAIATWGGQGGKSPKPDDYPALTAKVLAASRALTESVPAACQHLKYADPAAFVCIDEPGQVMCIRCTAEHDKSAHPRDWDYQCLECGAVDMRGVSPIGTMPILGLPVHLGAEVVRLLTPVMMTGLAICNPCRLAAGKKRLRGAP